MNEAIRYIKWDYDNNIAIEYERKGECNGCGACCIAVIKFRINGVLGDRVQRGGTGTEETGVWNEVSRGNVRRFFGRFEIDPSIEHRCTQLSEDKRCNIQLTKDLLCKAWPLAPEHVTPFPDCSYEFVEIQRWDINPKPEQP